MVTTPFSFLSRPGNFFSLFLCLIHQRQKTGRQASAGGSHEDMVVAVRVLLVGIPSVSLAAVGEAVEVSIVTDNGHLLSFYPHKSTHGLKKVYAEAIKGDNYRIVVRNKLNRRVGVVVAVDGRNIISGQKSWLKNNERMYILKPYATNEYSGWRTGQERVNRFYFTDVPDSYAAAFGDQSAMGVIALAATRKSSATKDRRIFPPRPPGLARRPDAKEKASPSARGEASQSAGTGYGQRRVLPLAPGQLRTRSQGSGVYPGQVRVAGHPLQQEDHPLRHDLRANPQPALGRPRLRPPAARPAVRLENRRRLQLEEKKGLQSKAAPLFRFREHSPAGLQFDVSGLHLHKTERPPPGGLRGGIRLCRSGRAQTCPVKKEGRSPSDRP